REEQRRIREEIREEERARKEYEKAIKQAEKEEKMLAKALKQAEEKLKQAAADEKAKYEQQLNELLEELQIAKEKGQRAISMAQQTKQGHVYIISNIGSFGENIFKIGLTRRLNPLDRVKELGDASVPFSFDVHAIIHSEDAPNLERELHKAFKGNQVNKVNPRKEFFNIPLTDIKNKVLSMNLENDTHWTMKAEAMEYRESLQLSKKQRVAS
ncbi:MAG: GIY-YIG nuclease family protein, partial [Bacteroidota bacterium]